MAVGLYKYDGDINDRNSKLILSENISSQQFYSKYWEKAIDELGIKYLQDGAEFDKSKIDIILKEIKSLLSWADINLIEKDLAYMKERLENLQKIIPTAFDDDKTILYIF